jgi:hypothetical protein
VKKETILEIFKENFEDLDSVVKMPVIASIAD